MALRPRALALDIIETTFSLGALRPRLRAEGLPAESLELWFARTLRDAFALAVTDRYAPFTEVARATLMDLARQHGVGLGEEAAGRVLAGFGALQPQPDAAEALRLAREGGVRVAALSNGAAETTRKLLERAGLAAQVDRVLSIGDIRQWKPRRAVYLHAAEALGVVPARLGMVATHAWDLHGAKCAGLTTGFVARGQVFPPGFAAPDVAAEGLAETVRQLLELPEG